MTKLKFILPVTIILVIALLITGLYLPKQKNTPVSHAAVRVKLNQSEGYELSLEALSVENSYYSDYKLAQPFGYYTIKIFDSNKKEIFSGRAEKNKVFFPPYEVASPRRYEEGASPDAEPLDEIILLLPFFPKAKKLVLSDDKNQEKLTLDLTKITLPKNLIKNFCGNGICDSNENIVSCFKDCRIR